MKLRHLDDGYVGQITSCQLFHIHVHVLKCRLFEQRKKVMGNNYYQAYMSLISLSVISILQKYSPAANSGFFHQTVCFHYRDI